MNTYCYGHDVWSAAEATGACAIVLQIPFVTGELLRLAETRVDAQATAGSKDRIQRRI
jgi:hypothetical protein